MAHAVRGSRGGGERIEGVMVEGRGRQIVVRGMVGVATGGQNQVVRMAAERAARNFNGTEEGAMMMTVGDRVIGRRLHLPRVSLQGLCPSKKGWMGWPRKSWPVVERIPCLTFPSSSSVPGSASM